MALEARRQPAEEALGDVIVGLGNAEPKTLIYAIKAKGGRLVEVRLFQRGAALMRRTAREPIVLAASASDPHGYFSLGYHAEYLAAMIGEMPFFT